jgi:hypothetical protein
MSKITFTSAAVAVVSHERKSFRTEVQYDFLAAALDLSVDTESGDMTDAARRVVLEGAANDGTVTGAALTTDDLTGRDPGAGSKTREYWKAARAVRIGLVKAVKRAAGDDESESETIVNLLTQAGLKANLDDVVAAWKAAQDNN